MAAAEIRVSGVQCQEVPPDEAGPIDVQPIDPSGDPDEHQWLAFLILVLVGVDGAGDAIAALYCRFLQVVGVGGDRVRDEQSEVLVPLEILGDRSGDDRGSFGVANHATALVPSLDDRHCQVMHHAGNQADHDVDRLGLDLLAEPQTVDVVADAVASAVTWFCLPEGKAGVVEVEQSSFDLADGIVDGVSAASRMDPVPGLQQALEWCPVELFDEGRTAPLIEDVVSQGLNVQFRLLRLLMSNYPSTHLAKDQI